MTEFNLKGQTNDTKTRKIRHCGTRSLTFHVVVFQRTAKKCTKIKNARAEPLRCSFHSVNLLFGDVLVAVAVVAGAPVKWVSGVVTPPLLPS